MSLPINIKHFAKNKATMKIKVHENIYDVILPIYVLSKILGLAPFTFTKRKLKPNYGPLIVFRIALVIGGMSYSAYVVETLQNKNGIAVVALKCELYLGTLMTFTVLTLAVANQKLLIRCIEKLVKIDLSMQNIQINVYYKNSKKFVLFQVIAITCVFLSKLILQFFTHSATTLSMYSAFNVFDYINTIMLFQYVDLLLLIRQRFIWMNRKLRNLPNSNNLPDSLRIPTTPIVCDGYNRKRSMEIQFNAELILNNLAKIYGNLCHVSRMVNRTYGVQILVTIGSRFVMITTQSIKTYNMIRDPTQGSGVQYALLAIYLMLHTSKIFMVASLSENTSAKAKETGIYLHNIWKVMHKLKNQIEYFSLQILHQDLVFKACGFFVLDYTLIYAIVGALTTYLIIVIQLEKAI